MGYWIWLMFLFIVFTSVFIMLIHTIKKGNGIKSESFVILVICNCVLGFFLICFGMDIPSALSGGQEMYVKGSPQILIMEHSRWLCANGEMLFLVMKYDLDKNEPYAEYRITYTEFTNTVLAIEKVG